MTFRLVGLMSAVILLSLASFGLLVGHYQDQVMDEVARTASDVGKATLRTLEVRGMATLDGHGSTARWHAQLADPTWTADGSGAGRLDHLVVVEFAADGDSAGAAGGGGEPGGARVEECLLSDAEQLRSIRQLIEVDDVRAISDPGRGLMLKIPKLTQAPGADPAAGNAFVTSEGTGPGLGRFVRREEILLPIQVGAFDQLFRSMRSRSLALFFAVFVVGTVLSTGLAAHFTRPIRRLDGAFRRLSEGDLDVSVPDRGRDEIGRLSRAFNDMAGRLRANRDRARELVRREKLSALGRMAAGVAHDVRNPLHSIGLTLQHLSETARPDDSARAADFDDSLRIIRGEIRRLDELVGNFLRFARSERQERAPIDVAELLRETARLVGKEAERRGVELSLEIADGVPRLRGDAEAIRSSLLNLVLNSLEAMPGGGRLSLSLAASGDAVRVEVADTGRGIPEQDRERVFDFAYTTREGGHGLGLAMVHHCVVEEHGGRVALDSRPGEGTRVRLTLPADPPETAR